MPCIDAPMSGGPARARDGTMSLMVACADAVFTRHEPVLRDLSSRLVRLGQRIGDGARTKLVNNLLAAVNLAAAAEALALAERLGLDPRRTLQVFEQIERAKLDRQRPPAACARGRLRAACPHQLARQGHRAGAGDGRRRGPAAPARRDGPAVVCARLRRGSGVARRCEPADVDAPPDRARSTLTASRPGRRSIQPAGGAPTSGKRSVNNAPGP